MARHIPVQPARVHVAARSPKGKAAPAKKPQTPSPSSGTKSGRGKSPAAATRPKASPKPTKAPPARPVPVPDVRRRMGRGRKPPVIPEQPVLPPPPPAPPDFKGAAPTMHYGEAPVPPKKKKSKSTLGRSTAARAAEAARAAVWAVSSEKTTDQIKAAEGAFEAALEEHKADAKLIEETRVAKEEAHAAEAESAPPGKRAPRDRWAFFHEELSRPSDPDDPHEAWRKEMGQPRHEMFAPASDEQLDAVEAGLRMKLPLSYREFNLSWGGGRLFTQEWRNIRLVGAVDMAKEMRERLCDRMHKPFLPLADLGDGDYLVFDTSKATQKGEAPVFWWYGGKAKKKIAGSFSEWLEQLVAHGGEAFWWDEE